MSTPGSLGLLDTAADQLKNGEAVAALVTLDRARKAGLSLDYPWTARRYFSTLAEARYRAGHYAEALPAFERALRLDPGNERLRRLATETRERLKTADQAAPPANADGPASRSP
jgi:tetratricopeptide (TPR) repeat protein